MKLLTYTDQELCRQIGRSGFFIKPFEGGGFPVELWEYNSQPYRERFTGKTFYSLIEAHHYAINSYMLKSHATNALSSVGTLVHMRAFWGKIWEKIRPLLIVVAFALAIFYYATHPAATAPSDNFDDTPEYSPQ